MGSTHIRNRVKRFLRMCGEAFSSSVHERLDALEAQLKAADLAETQAALLRAAIHTLETLEQTQNYALVENGDPRLRSPELGLIDFLYSYLPSRIAVLIGSGGEIAGALRDTGYEVHAVSCAEDLPEAAHANVGLVRIGVPRCDALWGAVIVRVFNGAIEDVVGEMRSAGYAWHIALYQVPGSDRVRFYSNHRWSVPESRGEVFFFRDYAVFAQAQAWCAAMLPRTYFKPAQMLE